MSEIFEIETLYKEKKYSVAREDIANYIGIYNLVKIEDYFENRKLLLELYNEKKLQLACKALELVNIYSNDCGKSFFYSIRFFLPNLLTQEYMKIRNEVYQYLGFDLTISLEIDPNFQNFCIKLHKRQDIFMENMMFFKRFTTLKIFQVYDNPYSLEFLDLLQYDFGHLILTENIFEQKFSLEQVNTISAFLIENNLTDSKSNEVARFAYIVINDCTKEDLEKIYKYKSSWVKAYEYCHNINYIFDTLTPIFFSATKFILFFRTLNHSKKIGDSVFYSLIFTDKLDKERINKHPYCYAKNLNES